MLSFFVALPIEVISVSPVAPSNLRNAVLAAAPGDTLFVDPGAYDPIVIDKPITIVATGAPGSIEIDNVESTGGPPPFIEVDVAILLAGPGAGRVVLEGFSIVPGVTGSFGGDLVLPAIFGGGFDEVLLANSTVASPSWLVSDGVADSAPAIDVDLPLLVISDSTVTGGRPSFCALETGGILRPPLPAVETTGHLTALDSILSAGEPYSSVYSESSVGTFAGPLDGVPGVLAGSVSAAESSLEGSEGITILDAGGGVAAMGSDGPPSNVGVVDLGLGLDADNRVAIGQTWVLSADSGAAPQFVGLSNGLQPPLDLGSLGLLAVQPNLISQSAFPAGGSAALEVPAEPALIGRYFAAQALDGASLSLTRPAAVLVTP